MKETLPKIKKCGRFSQPMRYTISILVLMLAGCANMRPGHKPLQPVPVTPEMIATSFDYTKPGDIDSQNKPAYILPQVSGGWQKAKADNSTGEWRSGQYVAKVIEGGHWATVEEAELSGKPYVIPGGTKPIIPMPVQGQPSTRGEISATSIEEKLSTLDKKLSQRASDTSVANQVAVAPPENTVNVGRAPATSQDLENAGFYIHSPSPTATPAIQNVPPTQIEPSPTPFKLSVSTPPNPTPTSTPSATATPTAILPPPLVINPKAAPTGSYDAQTGTVLVGFGDPNTTYTVQSPKGDVLLSYLPGGKVNVTYNGKTQSIDAPSRTGKVKITLE